MKKTILSRLLPALFLAALLAGVVSAAEIDTGEEEATGSLLNAEELNQLATEPPAETDLSYLAPLISGNWNIGHNSILSNEAGYRAYHYGKLRPSLVGSGALTLLDRHHTIDLDGYYLSDSDNQASLAVDFAGHYRFQFSTEALYHNLPAERFLWNSVKLSNGNIVNYDPQPSTNSLYGITARQDKAMLRVKPTDYPFHIDLGFRRFTREGTSQLRFADVRFASPSNMVYNRQVAVDQATYEGTAGFDAHLGYLDVVNQFTIRQFVDDQSIPQHVYQPQYNGTTLLRNGGLLQHNENPESRYWANTLRLHSSISSGLVGALSYTYAQRQSLSELTDIAGVADIKTVLRNMAGDLTYTPRPEFTASFKYRRQVTAYEMNPEIYRLTVGGGIAGGETVPVQMPVDSRLDSLIAALVYRPISWLVMKGEFKGDFVRREIDKVGQDFDPDLSKRSKPWLSHHHEDRYQGRATVTATPAKGMRIKAQYGYTAVTHPLYATTFENKHFGEFIASYNRVNLFGTSVSYRESQESTIASQHNKRSITTSGWVNPVPRLTLNVSFAYLQSDVDRTIAYPNSSATVYVPGSFQVSSHLYGVQVIVHPLEEMDVSVGYQQVRSASTFNSGALPDQPIVLGLAEYSTAGLSEISRTNDIEHEVTTRVDYRLSANFSSTLEYMYRVIHNQVDASLDGDAHQLLATVGFRW